MKTRSKQQGIFETDPQLKSLKYLSSIQVSYKNEVRWVTCFCGRETTPSILPHMRREHPDVWKDWCSVFVTLRNRKWSTKRIMNMFTANGVLLFTWTVIEKELRSLEERGEAKLLVWQKDKIRSWHPQKFKRERTTVWNFPNRGDWAVHQGDYRGNWPPQLVRNLISSCTRKGDLVVDLFVGGGTTLIESWLTGRRGIGLDISEFAIKMTNARLKEMETKAKNESDARLGDYKPIVKKADSRACSQVFEEIGLDRGSVALICAHPPYLGALKYTNDTEGELSRIKEIDVFLSAIRQICVEAKPWLKPNGTFAILIGDVRKNGKLQPLGFMLLNKFLEAGYALKEIIIKTQNQDQSTHLWAKNRQLKFRIAHEYLFVFSNRQ